MGTTLRDVQSAARSRAANRGPQNKIRSARSMSLRTIARERPDALIVEGNALFFGRRVQLVHLATLHRIATTYASRDFAVIGGLMSYGSNITDAYRQVGIYAGRLKGAKPADLPVMQPNKFELVVTTRPLGYSDLPCRHRCLDADQVIE